MELENLNLVLNASVRCRLKRDAMLPSRTVKKNIIFCFVLKDLIESRILMSKFVRTFR